jgi:hypothetical protein
LNNPACKKNAELKIHNKNCYKHVSLQWPATMDWTASWYGPMMVFYGEGDEHLTSIQYASHNPWKPYGMQYMAQGKTTEHVCKSANFTLKFPILWGKWAELEIRSIERRIDRQRSFVLKCNNIFISNKKLLIIRGSKSSDIILQYC